MRYKRWDIYYAEVKFEESPESKHRPIIIYNDAEAFVVSIKVTSQNMRPGDYQIQDWADAGLAKPSVARLDKMIHVSKVDIKKRIGRLTEKDIQLLTYTAQIST